MAWNVNTNSPMYQSMTPDQQQQVQQMAQSGNIPISLDQLQSQLKQTQASTGEATAVTTNVQAGTPKTSFESTQVTAPTRMASDIHNGMTLKNAIDTYKTQGVDANTVFAQYLAQSPNGYPKEDPTTLKHWGVTDQALGQVGKNGDYQDIYNTRNAILNMRDLRDAYHQTGKFTTLAKNLQLPFLGIDTQAVDSKAYYDSQRNGVINHLNTLLPGSPIAEGSTAKQGIAIPDTNSLSDYQPGVADNKFLGTERSILKSKGYSYKELGLSAPEGVQASNGKGGQLLDTILGSANSSSGGNTRQALIDLLQGNVKQAGVDQYGSNPADIIKNTLGLQKDTGVGGFNAALATTAAPGFAGSTVGRLLGGGKVVEGAGGVAERLPSFLKSVMRTGAAQSQTGEVRGKMLEAATNNGATINGDNIVSGFQNWAKSKIQSSNSPKDIQAVNDAIQITKDNFAGKTMKPTELKSAYDEISNAFSKTGIPKTTIEAEMDEAKRKVFDKVIGGQVPGWNQTMSKFNQIYNLQKSPGKKIAERAAVSGVGTLMSALGLGEAYRIANSQ